MAYGLCDELQSAHPLKYQPLFLGMSSTQTFQILDLNTKVELNMFFVIVIVVAQ